MDASNATADDFRDPGKAAARAVLELSGRYGRVPWRPLDEWANAEMRRIKLLCEAAPNVAPEAAAQVAELALVCGLYYNNTISHADEVELAEWTVSFVRARERGPDALLWAKAASLSTLAAVSTASASERIRTAEQALYWAEVGLAMDGSDEPLHRQRIRALRKLSDAQALDGRKALSEASRKKAECLAQRLWESKPTSTNAAVFARCLLEVSLFYHSLAQPTLEAEALDRGITALQQFPADPRSAQLYSVLLTLRADIVDQDAAAAAKARRMAYESIAPLAGLLHGVSEWAARCMQRYAESSHAVGSIEEARAAIDEAARLLWMALGEDEADLASCAGTALLICGELARQERGDDGRIIVDCVEQVIRGTRIDSTARLRSVIVSLSTISVLHDVFLRQFDRARSSDEEIIRLGRSAPTGEDEDTDVAVSRALKRKAFAYRKNMPRKRADQKKVAKECLQEVAEALERLECHQSDNRDRLYERAELLDQYGWLLLPGPVGRGFCQRASEAYLALLPGVTSDESWGSGLTSNAQRCAKNAQL